MTVPVQLSDLPIASSAANTDLMLLRKGLTDYQCAVSIIRDMDLTALSSIPFPENNDLLLLSHGGSNYSMRFSQVGFVQGVKMWFANGAAPTGWTLVPSTGDRLLAVSDGTNQYSGTASGSQGGTWQQNGHSLTLQQIPTHRHAIVFTKNPSGESSTAGPVRGKNRDEAPGAQGETQDSGGVGGVAELHNHGALWRPAANVGIIGVKSS